jgi:hypothetical protein
MSDSDQSLKVLIELGLVGQENAEAAKKSLQEIQPEVDNLSRKTAAATDVSEAENISFREKHEIIRGLTQAFPGLGEAVIYALHPATLAAFAIGGAFEIFKKRVEDAGIALSDLQMPDLTGPVAEANNLAQAWDGIKQAVDAALQSFNSAESAFSRTNKALDAQKTAADKAADAQKQKALADLDAQKPGMDEATYAAKKADIERDAAKQKQQADQEAQQQALAAKYKEKANAEIASQTEAQRAGAIKLPDDEAAFNAQQKQLQAAADNFKASAAKARDEVVKVQNTRSDLDSSNLLDKAKGVAETVAYGDAYGYGMSGGDVIKFQNQRAQNDEDTATAIEKSIAARQKQFDAKKKLQEQAAKDAGLAAGLGAELPGDRAAADAQKAADQKANAQTNAASAENSATGFLNTNSGGQQTIAQLRAHIAENQKLQAELQQAAAELIASHAGSTQVMTDTLKQLSRQINNVSSRLNSEFIGQ